MESQSTRINEHLDCNTSSSLSSLSFGATSFGSSNLLMKFSSTESYASNGLQNQSSSHQLVSNNSFELNVVTSSISEDSGLPHTNCSISSGDSSRMGLCKFEVNALIHSITFAMQFIRFHYTILIVRLSLHYIQIHAFTVIWFYLYIKFGQLQI